jgi:hypothetical protein
MLAICGEISYSITTDLSVYIEYDASTHTIVIYCEDMDVYYTGSYTYTISVYLTAFASCNCEDCCVSTTNVITIINPCTSSVLTASAAQTVMISYSETATVGFPSLTVAPSPCAEQVTYSCAYESGPYTGTEFNLCSFEYFHGDYSSTGQFNSQTGALVFSTNDMNMFPVGSYRFTLTATVGL